MNFLFVWSNQVKSVVMFIQGSGCVVLTYWFAGISTWIDLGTAWRSHNSCIKNHLHLYQGACKATWVSFVIDRYDHLQVWVSHAWCSRNVALCKRFSPKDLFAGVASFVSVVAQRKVPLIRAFGRISWYLKRRTRYVVNYHSSSPVSSGRTMCREMYWKSWPYL